MDIDALDEESFLEEKLDPADAATSASKI